MTFESPGNGRITFGWDDPLEVDGQEVSLREYDRFANPYTRAADFGSGRYELGAGGHGLILDFDHGVRSENGG